MIMFDQMSGHHDAVKLTHKINQHRRELDLLVIYLLWRNK